MSLIVQPSAELPQLHQAEHVQAHAHAPAVPAARASWPQSELDTLVSVAYLDQLWRDCLSDCAYATSPDAARQLFSKIAQAVAKQINCQHVQLATDASVTHDQSVSHSAAHASSAPAALISNSRNPTSDASDVSSSSSDDCEDGLLLKWEKPGALARRVGVKQSVLRTLADAHAVKTMMSPGGHRLFNVASVLYYINSQSSASKEVSSSVRNTKRRKRDDATVATASASMLTSSSNARQLLVFMRLGGADQSQAKQNAAASEIQSQVFAHMKGPCTRGEMESCSFFLELDSDEPGQTASSLFNTPATRNLLKCICSREHARSLLILRTFDDISSEPSTCSLFKRLCSNMNVLIQLLPQLPSQL